MSAGTESLVALREAALRRDWNGCRAALEVALSQLSVPQILRLAQQEVQHRLPLYERYHPHVQWPRRWLEALAAGSPQGLDDTAPEVLEDTPGPGANNFAEAVYELYQAVTADSAQCVAHAGTAIAHAIKAEMLEKGGSQQPELWNAWYQDAVAGNDPHPNALLTLMKIPQVAATELAAWNRLAEELFVALSMKPDGTAER